MIEEWRDIPGYSGYQASTEGRIRSVDRVIVLCNGRRRPHRGRVLVQWIKKSGHAQVAVGLRKNRDVHVLVARTFHGACPIGHEVLHRNHAPADNRPTNLKYGTRSENLKMDYEAGRRTSPRTLQLRYLNAAS